MTSMADHIYEGAWTYTSGAAAHAIGEIIPATLAAGKRPPEIREIGIFLNTAVAAQIGLGRPAAIGITPATEVTVQAADSVDVIAGNTVIAGSWATAPTVPGTFMRRADLPAQAGAGLIWVWNPGEFVLWSGAAINTLILWQISALAVTYDLYIKVAE
jgi:hypothetical protein